MGQDIDTELAGLGLQAWGEDVALELGHLLLGLARARDLPVVIDIRDAGRSFFHAALPGSSAQNDNWARRKSNLALYMGRASMAVTLDFRAKGRDLATEGLSEADYALSGGAVPLRLGGAMVAVATVSGLPEMEDHRLVVEALGQLIRA
ncbi:heme-binding protein [Rhodobacter sp. KR11]|uniref:heme-binding protein n=1 Tax=Rhodobacter sp. KR11 TaxID=2974588 RepID=UPI002221A5CC|nr:heme-binding protein [Rhodobacter sp. KR11]MCW1919318.1 heme-binding protein [Rhodobacter sp. KR11]